MGHFGTTLRVVEILWGVLNTNGQHLGICRVHLFWALFFLKTYSTLTVCATMAGVHEHTFSKWCFLVIFCLFEHLNTVSKPPPTSLRLTTNNQISFDSVLQSSEGIVGVIDATECPVQRSKNHSIQYCYYSGKKKLHTMKYEIVTCPHSGTILWIAGGIPGGLWHDSVLAQKTKVLEELEEGQYLLGDSAYLNRKFPQFITTFKKASEEEKKLNRKIASVRIHVERIISRIKVFNAVSYRWRHSFSLHPYIFKVCAEITNLHLFFVNPF